MSGKTKIEWTEYNWNFLRGCKRVSEGCRNCYAEKIAGRFSGEGLAYHGLATMNGEARWTGEISFDEKTLLAPLKRKIPTTYFVNSMSDLFYEKVTDEMIDKALAVMALCPQHTFQILTKRPERMKAYFEKADQPPVGTLHPKYWRQWQVWASSVGLPTPKQLPWMWNEADRGVYGTWPLPNVWLGVSVEDQKTADERIPILLQTPAAIRWLSVEPLLGPVDLSHFIALDGTNADGEFLEANGWGYDSWSGGFIGPNTYRDSTYAPEPGLHWIVCGGESGPRSRPCDINWIRSIVQQCKAAGVPVFVKQLGAKPFATNDGCHPDFKGCGHPSLYGGVCDCCGAMPLVLDRKGGNISEFPSDLQIREFPNA